MVNGPCRNHIGGGIHHNYPGAAGVNSLCQEIAGRSIEVIEETGGERTYAIIIVQPCDDIIGAVCDDHSIDAKIDEGGLSGKTISM